MDLNIFTDGSCKNNGGDGAVGGIGVHFYDSCIKDITEEFVDNPTNQRTELYAIYRAIVDTQEKSCYKKINIYTDSTYSIYCITKWMDMWKRNGWRTSRNDSVKNIDILKKIDVAIKNFGGDINFYYVKAHTSNSDWKSKGNKIADELARAAGNYT